MFKFPKNLSGRTYILAYGLSLAVLNALVKSLVHIPVHEIVFFRNAIMGLFTYLVLRKAGIPWSGNNKKLLLLRGLAGTIFVIFFYEAVQRIPLASATALHYTFPILSVILAAIFLKERPSLRQWFCFILAFGGVLMVKEFDNRVTLTGVLMAVTSALAVAVVTVTIRALRGQDHPLVVIFYLPLVGLILLGPYTISHWVEPTMREWFTLMTIGLLTQFVQYCLTQAYSRATVAEIGNLNYLTVVYSLGIGIIYFSESVQALSFFGMIVIVTASILGTLKSTNNKI